MSLKWRQHFRKNRERRKNEKAFGILFYWSSSISFSSRYENLFRLQKNWLTNQDWHLSKLLEWHVYKRNINEPRHNKPASCRMQNFANYWRFEHKSENREWTAYVEFFLSSFGASGWLIALSLFKYTLNAIF